MLETNYLKIEFQLRYRWEKPQSVHQLVHFMNFQKSC